MFFDEFGAFVGREFNQLVVTRMGSEFGIPGDGKIEATKVIIQMKGDDKVRDLGLTGTTWFDGRLDYGVTLETLRQSIGDKKIRRILKDIQKYTGDDSFPVKLRGTLSAPQFKWEPLASSPFGKLLGGGVNPSGGAGGGKNDAGEGAAKQQQGVHPDTIEDVIKLFTEDDDDDAEEDPEAKAEKKRRREERKKRRQEKRRKKKQQKAAAGG